LASYLNLLSWSFQINKSPFLSEKLFSYIYSSTYQYMSFDYPTCIHQTRTKQHSCTHIHTRPHKYIHTQISSGSFTSIRITNLTTVALNLHVNDDYFGCFRLFLTNTCFHFIPITVVVYHICMSLSTMCPVFFCILANSLTLLDFIQFLSKYKDHKNDQHLITCKIYAGQSYSRDITFLNVSASCVFILSSLKK
jgi:hypothetical protein